MRKIQGHDKRWRRETEWAGIIIHHTGVGKRKEISPSMWWRLYQNLTNYLAKKDANYVSAHYVISRGGSVTEVIDPDKYESYHAGKSSFFHPTKRRLVPDWNRYAIGIELIGDGNMHRYSDEQYVALAALCRRLMLKYKSIDPRCITGHENIAPDRKNDPGLYFDWFKFFQLLFQS